VLGSPTTIEIPPSECNELYYATLFTNYSDGVLNDGVREVTAGGSAKYITLVGQSGKAHSVPADPEFRKIQEILACKVQ